VIVYVKYTVTPLVGSRDVPSNLPKNGLGFIEKSLTFASSANKVLLKAGRKAQYAKYAASAVGRKDVPGLTLISRQI